METVRILVPEEKMEAAAWFYTDGLGLEEEKRTDGTRAFGIAGQQRVELVPLRGPLHTTRTKIRFHVHGIAECLRYLVSNGHLSRIAASEPWSRPGEMDITDPAGNVITLLDADRPVPSRTA
ncbi:VOC family protein [Bradyrhizobium liaoningense]